MIRRVSMQFTFTENSIKLRLEDGRATEYGLGASH